MSKKKSSPKPKQGHPARAHSGAQIVSIDEFRARSGDDTVLSAFAKWIRHNSSLNAIGDPVPALQEFLAEYRELDILDQDTVLHPSVLSAALENLEDRFSTEDFEFLLHVVLGYTLFLSATERWSGTNEQVDAVQEVIMQFVEQVGDAQFDELEFVIPAIDQATTYHMLSALPLARRLFAFFEWFGTKRDITSKCVLTRKDIEGAAAALDVSAIGVSSGATPPGEEPEGPLRVFSAVDVERLNLYWEALVTLGVIEIGSTKAALHNPLDGLEGHEHKALSIALLRDLALTIYRYFCELGLPWDEQLDELDADGNFEGSVFGEVIGALLLEASHEDGYPVEGLRVVTETLAGDDQLDMLAAEQAFTLLAAEGLIDVGANYSVPPVLKKTVVFLLAEPEDHQITYEDPADEDIEYTGAL